MSTFEDFTAFLAGCLLAWLVIDAVSKGIQ